MRSLIVGLGSVGRRHLANLRQLDADGQITVWRQHTKPGVETGATQLSERTVYSLDAATDPLPHVALVTSPAPLHVETARALVERGVHLFIEKPLSHSMDGVADLVDACRRRNLVAMVGYNLRFAESLRSLRQALVDGKIGRPLYVRAEIGQYLPDWRPGTDYRTGVSARSDLGGGVLLELSHEIDYVRWLMGEVNRVWARTARLSDLDIDVEDTAEINLEFQNGAMGSIHLDMVQRSPTRTCKVAGTDGTLTWDALTNQVRLYRSEKGEWTELHPVAKSDFSTTYLAELRHFLACVRGEETPLVSIEDGRRVLEIALTAKRSCSESRLIDV